MGHVNTLCKHHCAITLNRQVKKLNLAALVCVVACRDIACVHLEVSSGHLSWWWRQKIVIVRAVAYKLVDGCELHMSRWNNLPGALKDSFSSDWGVPQRFVRLLWAAWYPCQCLWAIKGKERLLEHHLDTWVFLPFLARRFYHKASLSMSGSIWVAWHHCQYL